MRSVKELRGYSCQNPKVGARLFEQARFLALYGSWKFSAVFITVGDCLEDVGNVGL